MPMFFNKLLNAKMKFLSILALTATLLLMTTGCSLIDELDNAITSNEHSSISSSQEEDSSPSDQSNEVLTSFEDVAQYIRNNGALPPNFITKKEAQALGWVPAEGNLPIVAPGKSIGGDRFGNREGLLPKSNGRVWYEADINYVNGTRGSNRIVYSNDGLIYMTTDHYKSFTDITKEGSLNK